MKPRSYTALSVLSGATLYFVLDLSDPDRGFIDHVVIALVCLAVLWNLTQLGRRLHEAHGTRGLWHMQRTVLFWIVGVLNTVLIRDEFQGTWKHWLGWALVAIAVCDTIAILKKENQQVSGVAEDDSPSTP